MADNFDMKKFLVENKLGAYSKLKEVEEAKKEVSKEQKIQVVKEWIWYTCNEGQAKDDINKYNKMVDMYFADKDDVAKEDFKKIYAKVSEKYGTGDIGADFESFESDWKDVQRGKLVNPKKQYEGEAAYEYEKGKAAGEKLAKEDMGKDLEDTKAAGMMDFLAEYEVIYVERNGTCYRKDDEGNMDEVSMSYCRRYSEGKKEMDESNLNEDASQTVIELLGMLAGLAGMGLSGVQILKWQDKLKKENPELHKQLGKVSGTISAADPSKNLEENEDGGQGIENDIEQDLMYTEDPILYLKSIIDFCNKKIEEIGQDTDGIEEAKKKIKEALTPEMFERMDAVTSTRAQLAMIKAAEIMMNELTEEGFEVLDIREYFTQLIANDI